MTIKAEVRVEDAYDGECRTYRLSVETGSFHAPNPEHMEGIARMLTRTLSAQARADSEAGRDEDDAEQWRDEGNASEL